MPRLGSRWRHRHSGRTAVVSSVWEKGGAVFYRYTEPAETSRGNGHMGPRTNTTPRSLTSFLKAFVEVDALWI